MKKTKLLIFLIGIIALVMITACEVNNVAEDEQEKTSENPKNTGEELLEVGAEYAYCYDTGAYDPTMRYNCELQLTYKECLEWSAKQEGTGKTEFKATFIGGEPTQAGRTANRYYMKVIYADNKEATTDTRAIFKEHPGEFQLFEDTNCYPNATIEVYNTNDELMDTKSFDYNEE